MKNISSDIWNTLWDMQQGICQYMLHNVAIAKVDRKVKDNVAQDIKGR